ncbi:MAG TPA: HAMP domain-containing sensor histidine kinase [Herpetosiphonaceae bacterium]|nr:HAMP domain-containing sensor histidine kinase [Herpetosiphonaceae bacterium]
MTSPDERHERVLLIAPTARDGDLTRHILRKAGLACTICHDLNGMCAELADGAALVLLPEEQVLSPQLSLLTDALDCQPAWSDLPIVVMTKRGAESQVLSGALGLLGNVLLIDRPLRIKTLLSVVQTSLSARRRQYQLRDQLEESQRLYSAEQQARAEAESAVKLRDVFLSIASHELKTPITSMQGYLQLLQRRFNKQPVYSDRDKRALQTVIDQVNRLSRIIQTLLDSSRMENGRLSIDSQAIDLSPLVRQVVGEFEPTLRLHTIVVEGAGENLPIQGDELRLYQVFSNVIGNAIKYSPQGGTVRVRLEQRENQACVEVADQGIGIPSAAIPQLFKRFYRGANVVGQNIGGMGIGLSVVNEIVALHGGSIQVDSVEGQGTTFRLCFPLNVLVSA